VLWCTWYPGKGGRDRYEKYSVFCNRRVEVLRDGASAQYGSDAMQGSEYYS
jgi:outer membrane cobalamin receptor